MRSRRCETCIGWDWIHGTGEGYCRNVDSPRWQERRGFKNWCGRWERAVKPSQFDKRQISPAGKHV